VSLLLYATLIASQALRATGLMVVKEGELKRPVSTITIVAHRGSTYYLLTTSHSVEDSKGVTGIYYFAPQGNDKSLQELNLVAAGECTYVRIAGDFWCPDDFAVFSFESPDRYTFVPLGDGQKIALGASVGYAGFPRHVRLGVGSGNNGGSACRRGSSTPTVVALRLCGFHSGWAWRLWLVSYRSAAG
jgi:hypothetical protein